MSRQSFAATVQGWADKSERRLMAIAKTATQNLIEEVLDRTPRDTGFLAASLTVSLGDMPAIDPTSRGAKDGKYEVQPYTLLINSAKAGDVIRGGFVASYSAPVEFGARERPGVGMVRLAAQNWQQHVDAAVREVTSKA